MMKLHAFDDRKGDAAKELGRHHALDLYAMAGMMTEAEYDDAVRRGQDLSGDERVDRSRRIVSDSANGAWPGENLAKCVASRDPLVSTIRGHAAACR
jgi:hypothetical protein